MTSKKEVEAAGMSTGFGKYYQMASPLYQWYMVVRYLFPKEKQGVRMASSSRLNKN